jgi:hypothetical protein
MANTYGDSGNRWWVGYNTAQENVLNPQAGINTPSGYESLPSGNATDDALFAAAAVINAGAKNPNTISVENISWFNINGPYTTQAAANAAIPAINKAHASGGVAQQVAAAAAGTASPGAGGGSGTSVLGFLGALSSANLWIRVAKVAIGGTILLIGLAKLTGMDKNATGLAAKAIKAAPLI